MNRLTMIRTRFRALFRKHELDADMDDEMRSHVEMRTQANIEVGMNPEEARFAALRQFGWTESIKHKCREQRGVTWLENLAQDIRYGARQLRKNPGFTAVAVLTLALGLGANTAAFGVVDRLMLRPLPVRAPQELVRIGSRVETTYYSFDYPLYAHYRDHVGTFSALAAYAAMPVRLTISGEAERARGLFISENYFTILGIESALGRVLRIESDAEASAPPVAVMYRPIAQIFRPSLSLHVRSTGNAKPLIAAVRREVRALDEHPALFDVRTLEQQKARSIFLQHALATLLGSLGLIGLGLVAVGLYGGIAYSVRQRTAEIGVRSALGAQQRDILSMVLGQGMRLALVGVAIGVVGALAATRLLRAVLFGVLPTDPLTFGIIPVLLIAVAALATWLPARRASQVNPMEALRCE